MATRVVSSGLMAVVCLGVSPMALAAGTLSQDVAAVVREHPLQQTKIGSCSSIGLGVAWNGARLRYTDGELTIEGRDQLGRAYRVTEGMGIGGCSVWAAALRGEGPSDVEIVTPGQDSSGGYDAVLTLLLFDAEGRPFPWRRPMVLLATR